MADHLFFPTDFSIFSLFSAGRVLGQRAAAAALHTVHIAGSAVAAQARTGGSQEPEVPVVAADILTTMETNSRKMCIIW